MKVKKVIRKDNVLEQPSETAPKKKKNKIIQDESEQNEDNIVEQPAETAPKKKKNKVVQDESEENEDNVVEQSAETAPKKKKNKAVQYESEEYTETSNKRSTRSSNKNKSAKSIKSIKPTLNKGYSKRKNETTKSFFEKSDDISNSGPIDTCKTVSFYDNLKNSTKDWTLETGDEIVPFEWEEVGMSYYVVGFTKTSRSNIYVVYVVLLKKIQLKKWHYLT